jgi:hypothetical protein
MFGVTGHTGPTGPGPTGPTGPTGPIGPNVWNILANNNIYYNAGKVGINTSTPGYPLEVAGVCAASSYVSTSDYRMKHNIHPLEENRTVVGLNPVEYDLSGGSHDMGFLAHEVQEIFPFLVKKDKDGPEMQSINYIGLIAVMVKEIKELKDEVNNLKKVLNITPLHF